MAPSRPQKQHPLPQHQGATLQNFQSSDSQPSTSWWVAPEYVQNRTEGLAPTQWRPSPTETYPAHKHTSSSCSPVSQTARMGASSQPCPTAYPQQSQPNHNRKACIFHTGHNPGAPGHGGRGIALLGPP